MWQHWTGVAKSNVNAAKGFACFKKTFSSILIPNKGELSGSLYMQIGLW